MIPTNPELRQFIIRFFSDEELETLCFDYFPEAANDFGGGMSKNRKAIVLIGHCERRGRLEDLRAAVARERPEAWRDAFAAPPVETFRRNVSPPTTERNPRQIFLSHATADAEFAHRLADDLGAEGWSVWIAPESIRPGEKWVEAIDRGLETSGVFVVVLTPEAVTSRWVRSETNAAIALEHRNRIRFLPIDVVESEVPLLWSGYQYLTFRQSYEFGLDKLLRWLVGEPIVSSSASDNEAYVQWLKPLPDKVFPPTIVLGPPPKPDIRIHEKTGIELIRIPAGPFLYGSSDADTMAFDDEKPQRTIDLPEYWIGRYPVTNAQFTRFIRATNYKTAAEQKGSASAWTGDKWEQVKGADWRHPRGPKSSIYSMDDHPVVQVNWDDAKAFCDWAGLALPTEEQWEKAARGTDGRIWPWGDERPTDKHCNFNRNIGNTTPVGRYSPLGDSPYGCADMAGNLWEWPGSWHTEDKTRALRGGSWDELNWYTRAAYRKVQLPGVRGGHIGFRVVELLSDPES